MLLSRFSVFVVFVLGLQFFSFFWAFCLRHFCDILTLITTKFQVCITSRKMLNVTRFGSRFLSKLNHFGGQNLPVLTTIADQRRSAKTWYPDKKYLKEFEEEVYLVGKEDYVISKNVTKAAPEIRVRNMVINMGPCHPAAHGYSDSLKFYSLTDLSLI